MRSSGAATRSQCEPVFLLPFEFVREQALATENFQTLVRSCFRGVCLAEHERRGRSPGVFERGRFGAAHNRLHVEFEVVRILFRKYRETVQSRHSVLRSCVVVHAKRETPRAPHILLCRFCRSRNQTCPLTLHPWHSQAEINVFRNHLRVSGCP